jgi:dolichol kinase
VSGSALSAALVPAAALPARPASGLRRELFRKAFHVAPVALPAFAWVAPRPLAAATLTALAVTAVGVDLARLHLRGPRYYFLRATRTLLRRHERRGFAGATWMAVAYAIAFLVFPRHVAVAGMLYNGLGDASAALVGKRFGRHRAAWGKSWEGCAAAFAACLAVGLAIPGIVPGAAVAGALAAAGLEFLPLPLDDNLRITLGGALACAAAGALL